MADTPKKARHSKTIWLNAAMIVAMSAGVLIEQDFIREYDWLVGTLMFLQSAGNVLLRYHTTQAIK